MLHIETCSICANIAIYYYYVINKNNNNNNNNSLFQTFVHIHNKNIIIRNTYIQ